MSQTALKKWTIKELMDWSIEYFSKNQIDSPKLTAQFLLSHLLKCNRIDLYLRFEEIIHLDRLKTYKELLIRRINNEPLEYIVGNAEFLGRVFEVNNNVLIPRPETEQLVDEVLSYLNENGSYSIVDIGTGSGVIAVSLSKKFPNNPVVAIDISSAALEVAEKNAAAYSADVKFLEMPMHNSIQKLIDLNAISKDNPICIVSNPPYIKTKDIEDLEPEVKDNEPMVALDGGIEGMEYIRCIIDQYNKLDIVKACFIEIGYNQKNYVQDILKELGISKYKIIQDYEDNPRIVKLVK